MPRVRRTLTSLVALATTIALAIVMAAPPAGARASDLAGLWLLNEGSGQVARDLSGNGNTGQLGSTAEADAHDPSWVALPRFLIKRAALRFNGSQRVRMANAPSLEPDGVTVVARLRSTQAGSWRYVMSKGAFQCQNASYGLYTGEGGGLMFYVSDGARVYMSADAGQAIWDGAWHTVVGSFNGNTVQLSVDGAMVGTAVPAAVSLYYPMPDTRDFFLGDYAGPCGSPLGFVGDIDAAAVIGHYETDVTLAP